MGFEVPVYAKAVRAALRDRRHVNGETPPRASTASRFSARLFRRAAPTTFQRCLAVHMHFAQHHSALD